MNDYFYVETGGVRLACRRRGARTAPPMVLLHALGEDGATWDGVADAFAAHFQVLTLDLRGHGKSDWPGTYSFELMRDDVVGVLDRLGLRNLTLAGHSMGGTVAYLIAGQQPSRVDQLILEDTPPPYPRDRAIPERPPGPLPFDWAAASAIISQVNQPDPEWWDRLTEITARTLIIGGGPGSHIRQDKLAEAATRIPTCELVTIPAGHHIHTACPTEFAAAVLAFARS